MASDAPASMEAMLAIIASAEIVAPAAITPQSGFQNPPNSLASSLAGPIAQASAIASAVATPDHVNYEGFSEAEDL